MPRPDQTDERRREFAPVLARTFADLGYRRTTTAALAAACEVQETILYRLWPDKRAMFIAALEFVYSASERTWTRLLEQAGPQDSPAETLLRYESTHHGEFGLYRIVFAGLSETDDPEIRAALRGLSRSIHAFVQGRLEEHHRRRGGTPALAPDLAAWTILGLGTVANLGRELGLLPPAARRELFEQVGRFLLHAEGETRV
jgi:AcrR family transcriptional regulator